MAFKQKVAAAWFVGSVVCSGVACANLIQDPNITVNGTGLGAVNTLVTAHDPGGSGNQNGTESGCVSFDSATGGSASNFDCLLGLQGGDNDAQNNTFLLSDIADTTKAGDIAVVVNMAELGQDVTVTLTDLYIAFYDTSGGLLGTFSYVGDDLTLTAQEGTGTGGSGFVFALDSSQQSQANALCPVLSDCILAGGFQFAAGSTSDGNETMYVISLKSPDVDCPPTDPVCNPQQQVPEPGIVALLGIAFFSLSLTALRRRKR